MLQWVVCVMGVMSRVERHLGLLRVRFVLEDACRVGGLPFGRYPWVGEGVGALGGAGWFRLDHCRWVVGVGFGCLVGVWSSEGGSGACLGSCVGVCVRGGRVVVRVFCDVASARGPLSRCS